MRHPKVYRNTKKITKMITIGVTSAGGGVGQSILHALSLSNLEIRVVCMDASPKSIGLYWSDSAWLVPRVAQENRYIGKLLEICERERLDIIIPGLDLELPVLSRHKEKFLEKGCRLIVSSPDTVRICRDKYEQFIFCSQRNLPFVKTISLESARQNADSLDYPAIVKPRDGSASAGATLVFSTDHLRKIATDCPMIVQDYLPPSKEKNRSLSGKVSTGNLDQSNEISVQYLVSTSGKVLGNFASVNLLKNGIPVEIDPAPDSPAIQAGLPIIQALSENGLVGPVNLQGRETANGIIFFEINARFTGITGLRASFGYKEVEAAIQDFVLMDQRSAKELLYFKPGYFGLRYVADSIVPIERINSISSQDQKPISHSPHAPVSKNIMVTGATGYLGANVIGQLLMHPSTATIRAVVRNTDGENRLKNALGNPDALEFTTAEFPETMPDMTGIDTVIHTATERLAADPSRFFLVNTEGTRKLLETMQEAGVRKFIYTSSQSVYGTKRPPLWKEEMPAQPENTYASSKWMGELLSLGDQYTISQVIILRVARLYGLGHFLRWDELPHKFAQLAAQGQPLPVFGGDNEIDILHIDDASNAVVAGCMTQLPPAQKIIVNIGSGKPVTISEFASYCLEAAKCAGLEKPLLDVQDKEDKTKPLHLGMDIRKAKEILGWEPRHSLLDSMKTLIAHQVDIARTG